VPPRAFFARAPGLSPIGQRRPEAKPPPLSAFSRLRR
jgi:hypothetical protein